MRIVVVPSNKCRKSAFKLKYKLLEKEHKKVLVVRPDSLRFRQRNKDKVINWGCSNITWKNGHWPPFIYNLPLFIGQSVNKLKAFKLFKEHGISHPNWTTNHEEAMEFGKEVVCRSILTGFGGAGIDIHPAGNVPPGYKLYVEYKKKKHEYRVHVFMGKVIDIAHKRKRKGFEGRNHQVRNYHNGWVYCREGLVKPEGIEQLAIDAVKVLGLDFGAVDIIYNEKENKCYVLEVNTAPGLEGTTLENYANAITGAI